MSRFMHAPPKNPSSGETWRAATDSSVTKTNILSRQFRKSGIQESLESTAASDSRQVTEQQALSDR